MFPALRHVHVKSETGLTNSTGSFGPTRFLQPDRIVVYLVDCSCEPRPPLQCSHAVHVTGRFRSKFHARSLLWRRGLCGLQRAQASLAAGVAGCWGVTLSQCYTLYRLLEFQSRLWYVAAARARMWHIWVEGWKDLSL